MALRSPGKESVMHQWKPVGLEVFSSLALPFRPCPPSPRTQTNPEPITTNHNGSQRITTNHNRSQPITTNHNRSPFWFFWFLFFLTWSLSGHTARALGERVWTLVLASVSPRPQLGDTLPSPRLLLSCWHQRRTRLYGVTSAMPWSAPPLLSTAGVSGERLGPLPSDC